MPPPPADLPPLDPTGAYVPDPNLTTGHADARPAMAGAPPAVPGYDVRGEIARGGMGAVYAAYDRTLGRDIAIKVLLPGRDNPAAVRRFVAEARFTAKLPHPGVPPVHAIGQLPDGRPFLVLKLIEGKTLADLLKARPSPADDLARFVQVFEQICQTVGYVHSRRVVHRDLKPANVMVGAFGEVQVMDWGLAKLLGAGPAGDAAADAPADPDATGAHGATAAGSVLGTPAYMAPEQARGEVETLGRPADVFALGGILCDVLTGGPPFVGRSSVEVIKRAAAGDVADAFARLDACGADADLVALCKRCLAPDPAGRPAHAGEVARLVAAHRAKADGRLRRAEAERAAAEARAKEEANTRRAVEDAAAEQRKRRWTQLALAVVLGVVATGGVTAAWQLDRSAAGRRADRERADRDREKFEAEQRADRDRELAAAAAERRADAQRRQAEDAARAQIEQVRVARNAEAITAWLARCEAALRADDADAAEAALAEADRRLPDGGGADLKPRIERRRAELSALRDLDAADDVRWDGDLESKTPRVREAADRHAAAFRKIGIVPGETTPAAAAARINESLVRDRLLVALADWQPWGQTAAISAILEAADPDLYRVMLREAVERRDNAQVKELAAGLAALKQPPEVAVRLSLHPAVPADRKAEIIRVALVRHPGDMRLLMAAAAAVTGPNQAKVAAERVNWLRAAVAARPGSMSARLQLGTSYGHAGDLESAIAVLADVVQTRPQSFTAHARLGAVVALKGDHAAAVGHYRESIRLNPRLAFNHFFLARELEATGDWDAAVVAYREALRLSPAYTAAQRALDAALKRQAALPKPDDKK